MEYGSDFWGLILGGAINWFASKKAIGGWKILAFFGFAVPVVVVVVVLLYIIVTVLIIVLFVLAVVGVITLANQMHSHRKNKQATEEQPSEN